MWGHYVFPQVEEIKTRPSQRKSDKQPAQNHDVLKSPSNLWPLMFAVKLWKNTAISTNFYMQNLDICMFNHLLELIHPEFWSFFFFFVPRHMTSFFRKIALDSRIETWWMEIIHIINRRKSVWSCLYFCVDCARRIITKKLNINDPS